MRSFDEFPRQIEALAAPDPTQPEVKQWHGRRAATLALKTGACDQLITAALLHDFAESVGLLHGSQHLWSSAEVLALLFPKAVVEPERLLPATSASDDGRDGAGLANDAHAMSRRLKRFVTRAHAEPHGPMMPIVSLLRIARRTALED